MSLLDRLRAEIAQTGPLTIAQYMHRCLHDPRDGYYATRPALGEAGDFLTAPLVSQMFGELLGLWAVEFWRRMGSPEQARLIEVGPGDGALMSDMLRAAKVAPAFPPDVWLVEASEPLKALQQARLPQANWAADLSQVPGGVPIILIANELLDCLPAHQFIRTDEGWAERMVGVTDDGLTFGLKQASGITVDASLDAVLETSPAQQAFAQTVAELIAREGGAALFIDYGRTEPGFGDTLQAVKAHQKVDPLACPGEADLTVHADFPAVMAAARKAGVDTAILTQGEFLRRMGIEQRAAALSRAAPERAETIGRQLDRLTAPDQMGELFKACCIHSPGLVPPGFEEAS
jgi:NADH dehydrogenase [ubiquinone] 1 alpha subcomplex assembly factor 7